MFRHLVGGNLGEPLCQQVTDINSYGMATYIFADISARDSVYPQISTPINLLADPKRTRLYVPHVSPKLLRGLSKISLMRRDWGAGTRSFMPFSMSNKRSRVDTDVWHTQLHHTIDAKSAKKLQAGSLQYYFIILWLSQWPFARNLEHFTLIPLKSKWCQVLEWK